MRKIIRQVIAIMIIMVIGYVVLANLFHVVRLHKQTSYDFSNSREMEQIQKEAALLKNNLAKLNTITETKHLNKDVYADIKGKLVWIDTVLEETKFLALSGTKFYSDKELMKWIIEMHDLHSLEMVSAYQKVTTADVESGIDFEQVVSSYMEIALSQTLINEELTDNYQYSYGMNNTYNVRNTKLWSTLSSITKSIELARNLSDYMVKDGDLNV